jgi:hypothetical protein
MSKNIRELLGVGLFRNRQQVDERSELSVFVVLGLALLFEQPAGQIFSCQRVWTTIMGKSRAIERYVIQTPSY